MVIVCSWCIKDGRSGVVGEKPPFDDHRQTHGICEKHAALARSELKTLSVRGERERAMKLHEVREKDCVRIQSNVLVHGEEGTKAALASAFSHNLR